MGEWSKRFTWRADERGERHQPHSAWRRWAAPRAVESVVLLLLLPVAPLASPFWRRQEERGPGVSPALG
jgi:hypothetical protein